jgi:hypothetical protein
VDEKQLHTTAVNDVVAAQVTDADADTSPNSASTTQVEGYVNTGGGDPGADDTGTRWPYDGDYANDPGGEGEGLLTVSVTIDGDAYPTMRDNPTTTTVDETNFTEEPGLGQFTEAVEISHDTVAQGDDNAVTDTGDVRTRILVFTDKEQATAPKAGSTEALTRVNAVASRIVLADDATTLAGATYDHDGDPDTAAAAAGVGDGQGFVCSAMATCTLSISDGKVTAISGYTFTGTATIVPVASMEDQTYLAFGVWLQETLVDGTNTYQFGAFADSGNEYDNTNAPVAAIVGTATYNGSAAGVKSTESGVDYFDGDAQLIADFGAIDTDPERTGTPPTDTTMGVIHGKIYNIMVDGVSMADAIYLDAIDDDNDATNGIQSITTDGTFDGRARMGARMTDSSTGTSSYPYNGTWQGTFYNQVAEDDDTTALEVRMPPMSAAGTFGVMMPDDNTTTMVDESVSYVGAFGAHRDDN